ncbi:MAG: helix-turn-helix domain-containing protein [archaeon]
MQKELEELGLTKNESLIYLFLLKARDTTTGSIIKETRIANSRVYESLSSLISKGLVTYNVQKDGKHFQAQSPFKFLEIENERKKKVEALIPGLNLMKSSEESAMKTAVYEGFEGFKTAFQKIIEDCPKNGEIDILGFSEQQSSQESLRTFITNMNLKSAKKKQKLRIILDVTTKGTLGKDREMEKFTQVKYMPKGYINPTSIDIFQDYVYIFLWEEKPFVFMIRNKKIAESFKNYFNFLWKIAK